MARKRVKESQYHTVSVPMQLWDKVTRLVESRKHGYRSEVEFILEAVRQRLRELHYLD